MSSPLWALGGVLVTGMLLRMPIGFSMIAAGIAYLVLKQQDSGLVAEQICNGLYNSYVLLAVPMFVFAANLMNAGTVSERLFDFCRILVGRLRGGLAQVDILVSVIFSGMSGSAIADGAMVREGWMFLVMLLLLLLALTLFPQIVLWLPQTMGYKPG